ncbi:MAG: hypothetical protein K2P80_05660, partial [Beijerinckiaceae bacterium]|nr:hypothetical protein [Beijerinckiaceae bacterium]
MAVASYRRKSSASSPDGTVDLPPGIIFGGPKVYWKNAESYVLLALFLGGSLGGVIWAAVYGISAIELWCFAIGFCVTTIGIGVGVAGVVLVVWHKIDIREMTLASLCAVVVALFAVTAGTLYQRVFCPRVDLRASTLVQFVASALVLAPLAWLIEGFRITW